MMLLRAQLIAVALTPALLVLPPAEGAMLVLPVVPSTQAETINWVRASGATLIGPGPYAGSMVVSGDRAALSRAALAHGALLSSASAEACGTLAE